MVRGAYGIQRVVNVVSQTVSGLMHYLDKIKLDAATPANTASTIVQRDGAGGFAAGAVSATSAAIAGAVSALSAAIGGPGAPAQFNARITPGTDAPDNILLYGTNAANNTVLWFIRQSGQFSGNAASASLLGPGADKTKLDGATPANVANTLMQRDGGGSFNAANATFSGWMQAGAGLGGPKLVIGGPGAPASNMVVFTPGADSPSATLIYGTNAANSVAYWTLSQDGHFSGYAAALGPGADRNKLDAIDPSTTYPNVNGVLWCRSQIATGRSMFTAQVAVTLTGAPDQLVLNNITTPSSRALNTYDMFCAYHGRNGGQVNVSFRPVSNGEPDYNGNQFQVAISTSPQPASISPPDRTPVYTNLNQVGTTGVVHLMFIERA